MRSSNLPAELGGLLIEGFAQQLDARLERESGNQVRPRA